MPVSHGGPRSARFYAKTLSNVGSICPSIGLMGRLAMRVGLFIWPLPARLCSHTGRRQTAGLQKMSRKLCRKALATLQKMWLHQQPTIRVKGHVNRLFRTTQIHTELFLSSEKQTNTHMDD